MHCRFRVAVVLACFVPAQAAHPLSGLPDVVLNEIMYAPSSPEPEWVELFNRGDEPVNVARWQISDATASRHLLPAGDIMLPAGGYLLLTKDSTALLGMRGPLPCAVVSVPGFPSLNNGGDAVIVLDALGRLVDSIVYRPEWGGNEGGRSLERRDVDQPSMQQDNWGTCASDARGTPGGPNSIVRLSNDLSIVDAFFPAGTTDTLVAVVRNSGKLPVASFDLLVYDDRDLDSIPAFAEELGRWAVSTILLPGNSLRIPCVVGLSSGYHQLIVSADFSADERKSDNHALCATTRAFSPGVILVNEIMAEPASGQSEYVELVNASDRDVDIRGWTMTDLTGASGKVVISPSACVFHPGELLTLAADSSLFVQFPSLASMDRRLVVVVKGKRITLNNDADAVVICDPLGTTIDSVLYSDSWHNPDLADHSGRSLERISAAIRSGDSRNWGTCVDPKGGTPGLRNSISVRATAAAARLSCTPNPFSPDGDGRDDLIVIHYEMPLQTSIINVKIYDVRGRLVRRLASNEPGGAVGNIVWDGRDDNGAVARIGVYIAFLEAVTSTGTVESAKGVLVLARRL
jgi:hypothetical protein